MKKKPMKPAPKKPDHYKVVCISFYTTDLDHLDGVVEHLRASGHTRASRSSVLRLAMRRLDVLDAGAEHASALAALEVAT